MPKLGRPAIYEDTTLVCLHTRNAKTKLQDHSLRRAIVDKIVDVGGTMTIGEINEAFGHDVSLGTKYLIRSGWLEIIGD